MQVFCVYYGNRSDLGRVIGGYILGQFLVIEGDNGSGKSTLATLLGTAGLHVASADPEIKKAEIDAKKLAGRERMEAFYAYNRQTGDHARDYNGSCVVVRYWPSTLAAAYADGVINKSELAKQCQDNIRNYTVPAVFVYLKCDHLERVKRIANRGATPGAFDDCSPVRALKYQDAIGYIAFTSPTPWVFLPSGVASPPCLAREVLALLDVFTPRRSNSGREGVSHEAAKG